MLSNVLHGKQEQQQIRVALVQKELVACQQQLQKRESEVQARCALYMPSSASLVSHTDPLKNQKQNRIDALAADAIARKRSRDILGAKKKMLERRRMQAQLEKLQNSILTIDMHKSTIEGSVLDRTVLETLRASGDALRQIGASTAGLRAVEEIVSDVEANMENAAEITKILSAASVTGMVNTMAIDGVSVDEDDLMRELDEMLLDGEAPAKPQFLEVSAVVKKPKKTVPVPQPMPEIMEEDQGEEEDTDNVRRLLGIS
jgi:hypothetical protein